MKIKDEDLEWYTKDLREGMGIGGRHLSITLEHIPSGSMITKVVYNGFYSKHRDDLISLMELLIDDY